MLFSSLLILVVKGVKGVGVKGTVVDRAYNTLNLGIMFTLPSTYSFFILVHTQDIKTRENLDLYCYRI